MDNNKPFTGMFSSRFLLLLWLTILDATISISQKGLIYLSFYHDSKGLYFVLELIVNINEI